MLRNARLPDVEIGVTLFRNGKSFEVCDITDEKVVLTRRFGRNNLFLHIPKSTFDSARFAIESAE